MSQCARCGCELPVTEPTANEFGTVTHPCVGNDVGTDSLYPGLPCAYVAVFACDIAWWKHANPTNFGRDPQPMLVPPGYYEGPVTPEPAQTYKAVFLGKDCQTSTGKYVQWEGLPGSPLNRVCDLSSTTSTTGRNPWTYDANGKVQYTPMTFDIRQNATLRNLFGGNDDDTPCCCWTIPITSGATEWQGWALELTDPGPGFRSTPRLHYLETADAFWAEVGREPPRYGFDYSFRPDGFSPFGENQFTIENPTEHPQLPQTVCVHPIGWPYFKSPCSSDSESCKSCAPAVNTYCNAGLLISDASVTVCSGSPSTADVSGSVASQCFEDAVVGSAPTEHNGTLPSGVSDPGGPCGYWWKIIHECDSNWLGALAYWNGSAWKLKLYCSTDSGATYSSLGDATVANVVCGCDGISFDWSKTAVECACCSCTPCTGVPSTLYATFISPCTELNGVQELTGGGGTWTEVSSGVVSSITLTEGGDGCYSLHIEASDCISMTVQAASVSCSPLEIVFVFNFNASGPGCCDGPSTGNTVTVTITA